MTITLISAANPRYADAMGTSILLNCVFSHYPNEPMDFCAVSNDTEPHGKDIYARAVAGEFGVVLPYVKSQAQIDADAKQVKDAADITEAKQYAKLQALRGMSPTQVQSWVTANVTNLTQAQDAIATLAIAVSILARRM